MSENTNYFSEWMEMASKPKLALLVDDSADDTELILRTSREFNIRWLSASGSVQALEMIRRRRDAGKQFQLIVLDLKIGSIADGIQLFKEIKSVCPSCPVLILSGYISNEAITEITKTGFAIFAQKPAVFSSDFFEQLFLVLNIPKAGQKEDGMALSGCDCNSNI